ncbi:hypothetical protein QE197_22120 (plasmid) [Arsenophonus nasoniae]|uniref:Uncharacterized protein n=2 Tax=Arsenophonus nasoniae TaxID=638 RepID=A0A4P7L9S2_9GAMM|nr:hypothetical protein [Arsenophonus nasoniae]QBY46578.1 hypothetical protein ArsFIN_51890 [Arsenophonus nasoniae]WGM08409.1 hypothetical protein QE258_23550 [Arsenophonus nasoniae]WGM13272.1 hypothetical protein QE197_22120 [Arsenophonus nasoniae]WGM17811.1 hypothetical protein QE193_22040 [Arsenophonus nasoniae]
MIQPNKHRTTFRRLKSGMFVFHNDEILKIIKLRERKMTEKGLMYHFDVNGGNGSLIGESGKRIFVKNK